MSVKIFKKDEPADVGITSLELAEFGKDTSDSRGLQKLELPNLAALGEIQIPSLAEPFQAVNSAGAKETAENSASEIIANAEKNARHIETAALEKAMGDFEALVAEEVTKQTADLRDNYASSIERLSGLGDEISKRVEGDLVTLALAISKKLIGKEISTDREIVVTLLNKALAKLSDRTQAEVHLNPDDLKFIESNREAILFRGTLELKPDPSISIGGCLIHTNRGDIDARIESQFEELSHGLIDV